MKIKTCVLCTTLFFILAATAQEAKVTIHIKLIDGRTDIP
jgi:hypothetical protein